MVTKTPEGGSNKGDSINTQLGSVSDKTSDLVTAIVKGEEISIPKEIYDALHPSKLDPLLDAISQLEGGDEFYMIGVAGIKEGNKYGKEIVDTILDSFFSKSATLMGENGMGIYLKEYKSFLGKINKSEDNSSTVFRRSEDTEDLIQRLQEILDESLPEDFPKGLLKIAGCHKEVEKAEEGSGEDGRIRAVEKSIKLGKNKLEHSIAGVTTLQDFNPFKSERPKVDILDEGDVSDNVYIREGILFMKERDGDDIIKTKLTKNGRLTEDAINLFLENNFPESLTAYYSIHKALLEINYNILFPDEKYETESHSFVVENQKLYVESIIGEAFYMEFEIRDGEYPNHDVLQLLKDGFLPEEMELSQDLQNLKTFASMHGEAIIQSPWSLTSSYNAKDLESFRENIVEYEKENKLNKITNYKGIVPEQVFNHLKAGKEGYSIFVDIKALGIQNTIEFLSTIDSFSKGERQELLENPGFVMTNKMRLFLSVLEGEYPDALFCMGGDELCCFIPEIDGEDETEPSDVHSVIQESLSQSDLSGRVFHTSDTTDKALSYYLEDEYATKAKKIEGEIDRILFRVQGEIGFYERSIDIKNGRYDEIDTAFNRMFPDLTDEDYSSTDTILNDLYQIKDGLVRFSKYSVQRKKETGIIRFTNTDQEYYLDSFFDSEGNLLSESDFTKNVRDITKGIFNK